MTPPPPRVLGRRQLLRATGLVLTAGTTALLGGCGAVGDAVRDVPRPHKRAANEDGPLLESARADLGKLLALCVAVHDRHPGVADLDQIVEHHRTQVDALGSDRPSASNRTPPHVPRTAKRALATVIDAEARSAHARGEDSLRAVSGDFARVLASISASCAQHVAELHAAHPGKEGAR